MQKRNVWLVAAAFAVGALLLTAAGRVSASALMAEAGEDTRGLPQQLPPPPPPPPGPGGPGGPGGLGPMLFELDLSATQIGQIKRLQDEARTASQPYEEQLRQVEDSLRTATRQATFAEDAVRTLLASEVKPMTELRVIRARTDAAIWRLLTTDQQAALAQMQQHPPRPPQHER